MPMYMQPIPSGYRFRRIVPEALRPIIGQTAIIVSLGKDYRLACRRAREEAVRSDQQFEQAKVRLSQRMPRGAVLYEDLRPITELTEDLKQQLQASWLSEVDEADQERRAVTTSDETAEERDTFRRDAQDVLALLKAAWRDGNVDPFLPALHTTLMPLGYRLDIPMADQRRLCLQLVRAALASYKLVEARDSGEDPPLNLPGPPLAAASPVAAVGGSVYAIASSQQGVTLDSLFEYWRDCGTVRSQRTVDDVERTIREFNRVTHNKAATQLVKADFIAYRDHRIKLGRASKTVEKDLSFIKMVMQFAFDSDKLPSNPAAGIKVPQVQMPSPQRNLEIEDLKKLFASPIYTTGQRPRGGSGDAAAWLPLMGLCIGARLEEVCQLQLGDIKTDAPIPYFRILDLIDEEDDKQVKRLKNAGSRRDIPIPQALIAHGFLEYVAYLRQQKETWLFPKLTVEPKYGRRGANWSKWWGRWRGKLDVTGRERCFHAFRHVFKTACRAAGIAEDIHDALTGHRNGHEGRKYGKFPLNALQPAIDRVNYPELKVDWIWQPPTPRAGRKAKKRTAGAT
jgi:integrase